MATLNITWNGLSSDVPLEADHPLSDADVRRLAVEVVRSGGAAGLHVAHLREDAFTHYEERIYLRPKVPFGA